MSWEDGSDRSYLIIRCTKIYILYYIITIDYKLAAANRECSDVNAPPYLYTPNGYENCNEAAKYNRTYIFFKKDLKINKKNNIALCY